MFIFSLEMDVSRVSDMSAVEMIRPRERGTMELVIRVSPKREKILNMSKEDSPSLECVLFISPIST